MATLTRLLLNPRRRDTQKVLQNRYARHEFVNWCYGYPIADARNERVLYRLDPDLWTGWPQLFLQSPRPPACLVDAERREILAAYVLDTPEAALSRELPPLRNAVYQFKLEAHPTHREQQRGAAHQPLFDEGAQRAWLARWGERHGFRLGLFHCQTLGWQRIQPPEKRAAFLYYPVRFTGMLEVTDPEKLSYVYERGIGRGKAFGLGLLSLVPA